MHAPIILLHKTIMLPSIFAGGLSRPFIHHCEKGWSWNPEPLRDFDLWLVLAGAGEVELRDQVRPLQAGSCLLFQPGDAPRGRHDPAHPLVVFAAHFRFEGGERDALRRLEKGVIHGRLPEWELARRSCEMAAQAYDEGPTGRQAAAALVRQIVAQLLHARARPAKEAGSLSGLALEIRSQPARSWNIAAMARRASLSAPHFNRRFRRQFGQSPMQYVIAARVARATTLLRESDMAIAEVAASTGYRDVFFFHRQFRQIAGVTPHAVRLGAATRLDDQGLRKPRSG
jgi:AraC-like DNA-binding protein